MVIAVLIGSLEWPPFERHVVLPLIRIASRYWNTPKPPPSHCRLP
jgi:hypothetical protein